LRRALRNVPYLRESCQGAAHLVVLAGGAGVRLRDVTRRLAESPVPKQFCRFGGSRSLLQRTIERTMSWIPPARVHVVVTGAQHTIAARQLRAYPGAQLLAQPHGRGTAPAALLGALAVAERDASALMVLAPCDHVFVDRSEFDSALDRACQAARSLDSVVIVGAEPDAPCSDYGWILTEARASEIPRVLALVEKPPLKRAQRLFEIGALWSTLIVVAPVRAFLNMYRETCTELLERFSASFAAAHREAALEEAYLQSRAVDLSADVLALASNLRACPLSRRAEWIDLGDERRLLAWLSRQRVFAPPPPVATRRGAST